MKNMKILKTPAKVGDSVFVINKQNKLEFRNEKVK